jgi:hypothetical protein
MPWRNHAQGSKHRHFNYPSTWRCGVNPGRFGGACGRRSGLQCRGCGRPLACHSLLRLAQPGVRGSACCRFGESATGRPDNCHQSRSLPQTRRAVLPERIGRKLSHDPSETRAARPIRNTRRGHQEHARRGPHGTRAAAPPEHARRGPSGTRAARPIRNTRGAAHPEHARRGPTRNTRGAAPPGTRAARPHRNTRFPRSRVPIRVSNSWRVS